MTQQTPITNTSGSYQFWLPYSDIVCEAFERCNIKAPSLSQPQLRSAYRSINLAQQTWTNRGVNLWARDLQTIPLVAGQATYELPSNTIQLLDVYLRNFPQTTTSNINPGFTASPESNLVALDWANHGLSPGNWINIVVPITVGGIILSGYYQVSQVLNANALSFEAATVGSFSDNPGGVPQFQATQDNPYIQVYFPYHGLQPGNLFPVSVPVSVGGFTLSGSYAVVGVIDQNNFTITGTPPIYLVDDQGNWIVDSDGNKISTNGATSTQTVNMNNTQVQIQAQTPNSSPTDRILYPISETDYAAIPNKFVQGAPTSFYYDRKSPIPKITLWQLPSSTGIYVLQYYRTRQLQDGIIQGLGTPDIPYRFFEAMCADLAARLAQKFAPDQFLALKALAKVEWDEAAVSDTERVPLYIAPSMEDYWS